MQQRLGLLLILIPAIASAAFVFADVAAHARPTPAPKTLEAPKAKQPAERDDAQSQTPQHSTGEVIGVPMFA